MSKNDSKVTLVTQQSAKDGCNAEVCVCEKEDAPEIVLRNVAVTYEIEPETDDLLKLKVIASSAFINAEGRAFPVVIDPQIIAGDSALYSYQNYSRTKSSSTSSGPIYNNWMSQYSIAIIKNKKDQYAERLQRYYKEYVQKKYELKVAVKHTPVNFLTDGKVTKGFNKSGEMVAVYDAFGNSIVVEYDEKDRISAIYEGKDKKILFRYTYEGQLASITDARGDARPNIDTAAHLFRQILRSLRTLTDEISRSNMTQTGILHRPSPRISSKPF